MDFSLPPPRLDLPHQTETFDIADFAASERIALRELSFLTSMQTSIRIESLKSEMVVDLHATVYSKQAAGARWTPPKEPEFTVYRWCVVLSWWQRLKLRRGFRWLQRLWAVTWTMLPERLDASTPDHEEAPRSRSRFCKREEITLGGRQLPEVQLPIDCLYPESTHREHPSMGPPTMFVRTPTGRGDLMAEAGEIVVDTVEDSERMRPIWVHEGTYTRLRNLMDKQGFDADAVAERMIYSLEHQW